MALTLSIKVVPSSGKSGWQMDKQGRLKCFLKAAPEKGAANQELIKTLAKLLDVTQQTIEIIAGLTDRNKLIKIHSAMTEDQFLSKIGVEGTQLKLLP
ncbi:MAG: DUF167 domain-containing protein [Proteobacteria bacterium]|nr:DUF167 domain-containing protein [Pseudomonadota bacterium]NBP14067.1 DUF167 domain-containing protein [bacterium]